MGGAVSQFRRDINSDVYWGGFIFGSYEFLVASLLIFFAWSLIGAYRLMRIELQFSSAPWVWTLFVLFVMVYFSGFEPSHTLGVVTGSTLFGIKVKLATSSIVALGLLYFTVLNESKSVVDLRRLRAALAAHDYRHALKLVPRWFVTLLLYCLASLILAVLALQDTSDPDDGVALMHLGALLLFALRDIGIVLFVGYGPRGRRRPENFALLVILLLYTIVPGILGMLTGGRSHFIFYPFSSALLSASILAPLVQAAFVWWAVTMRVKRELVR
jgi:hypothetical protein